jgi:hypothetical protein
MKTKYALWLACISILLISTQKETSAVEPQGYQINAMRQQINMIDQKLRSLEGAVRHGYGSGAIVRGLKKANDSLSLLILSEARIQQKISRLDTLERGLDTRIKRLESRVSKIDLQAYHRDKRREIQSAKSIAKLMQIWKKIRIGMTADDVESILGKPKITELEGLPVLAWGYKYPELGVIALLYIDRTDKTVKQIIEPSDPSTAKKASMKALRRMEGTN